VRRSEVTLTQVTVGTRVSYQDMHNPRRVGTVTAIDSSAGRARYTVAWDEPLTLPAHGNDLRPSDVWMEGGIVSRVNWGRA